MVLSRNFIQNGLYQLLEIAGPDKGERGENVGKIAICVCSPSFEKSIVKQFNDINRQVLRYKASLFALDFLISEFK